MHARISTYSTVCRSAARVFSYRIVRWNLHLLSTSHFYLLDRTEIGRVLLIRLIVWTDVLSFATLWRFALRIEKKEGPDSINLHALSKKVILFFFGFHLWRFYDLQNTGQSCLPMTNVVRQKSTMEKSVMARSDWEVVTYRVSQICWETFNHRQQRWTVDVRAIWTLCRYFSTSTSVNKH